MVVWVCVAVFAFCCFGSGFVYFVLFADTESVVVLHTWWLTCECWFYFVCDLLLFVYVLVCFLWFGFRVDCWMIAWLLSEFGLLFYNLGLDLVWVLVIMRVCCLLGWVWSTLLLVLYWYYLVTYFGYGVGGCCLRVCWLPFDCWVWFLVCFICLDLRFYCFV